MQQLAVKNIKRAQKESIYFREVSSLFLKVTLDDKKLDGLIVNRVRLTPDKKICKVYFCMHQGKKHFDENVFGLLKCYKPSLRTAIAKNVSGRYVPDFVFYYDVEQEKQEKISALIDKLKEEGRL